MDGMKFTPVSDCSNSGVTAVTAVTAVGVATIVNLLKGEA
jgi:hypothetical protein